MPNTYRPEFCRALEHDQIVRLFDKEWKVEEVQWMTETGDNSSEVEGVLVSMVPEPMCERIGAARILFSADATIEVRRKANDVN